MGVFSRRHNMISTHCSSYYFHIVQLECIETTKRNTISCGGYGGKTKTALVLPPYYLCTMPLLHSTMAELLMAFVCV